MKPNRLLVLATGFLGGLFIGSTSQAIRLAIVEKQTAPVRQGRPADLPAFLKDLDDDAPSTGSLTEEP